MRTYVNGTLYSVLVRGSLKERANEIGLADTHEYGAEVIEIWCALTSAAVTLLLAGEQERTAELLHAMGLGWDGVGFEKWFPCIDALLGA